MTLEHLRIVNTVISAVIHSLGHGTVPDRKADTALVKPSPDVDASVIESFNRSCEVFLHTAAKISDLNKTPRYAHPWFGPLNAETWYGLGAFHMNLHRRQVERILAGLREENPARKAPDS
jgi:hypothetical protein